MKFNIDEIVKQLKEGKCYLAISKRGNGKTYFSEKLIERLEAEERREQELLESECTNPNE